ncbi:MAG: phosphoglycerate dehydrogenase [Oligoflexia bacterium]|nr:phosphoglycerate dehydrogenase [Oligoflexia bacterium]
MPTSFPKDQIKVLLLENIHARARELFTEEGYQVETLAGALGEEQLKEKIRDVHVLGIRSKTQVSAAVLAEARRLLTLGCFCIGTNQVDLMAAKERGIPVFNAPFGNTRSVAEMVIGEIIMLSRQLGNRSMEMHQKSWKKISNGCFEVRGKTLGIVGYGNIGSQLSTLAEAMGMQVLFYDVISKLPMGNAKGCNTLDEVLKKADFVTLHVPATALTAKMIAAPQLALMKKGAYLINASRGNVVDIDALATALRSGNLAGAAIDVYPEEPESNGSFDTVLQGVPNVVLTPHIGGATEEAQSNIGEEVPTTLMRFINTGSTVRSVNFPNIDIAPTGGDRHRILNVHRNVPGVLSKINRLVSDLGANIEAQTLATDAEIGYLILETNKALSLDVKQAIEGLPESIKTRMLY